MRAQKKAPWRTSLFRAENLAPKTARGKSARTAVVALMASNAHNVGMRQRFVQMVKTLSQGLWERESVVSLGLLALFAGESLFLLGPPGVAKSFVARRLKKALKDAQSFEYLMGRFSTPEEIFGPLSLAGLRDRDVFERKTEGYLPSADVAFLDEIWRASPPIQNSLLTILNEKIFRNGNHESRVPLKLLIGASNAVPENEENSEAFWDRFIVRFEVTPLVDENGFKAMLQAPSNSPSSEAAAFEPLSHDEWERMYREIDSIQIPDDTLEALVDLRESFRETLYVSDRRWKKAVRILKTAAFVHERAQVDSLDLGLLEHMLWHKPSQKPEIVRLISETLEDWGWGSPVDVDSWHAQVSELRQALRQLTLVQKSGTVSVPILSDGEYFTLTGYPGEWSAKIWAQDFELLKPSEDLEGELYLFKPYGPFVKSEKHLFARTQASAEIFVDGRLFALESRPQVVSSWEKIVPDGKALRDWEKSVRQTIDQILRDRSIVEQEWKTQTEQARHHLFCAEPYLSSCGKRLEKIVLALSDLVVVLETLIETKDPGE